MKIENRKAYHEYLILEKMEAGIQLLGVEVKSIKSGRMKLDSAFVKFIGNELFLVNADVPLYQFAVRPNYQPQRSRKLLLHKRQIESLAGKTSTKRLTIVPLSCYTTHGTIKLEIGLAKKKGEFDKREKLKKRAIQKDIEREVRGKM
jgi:SsrA-binding protein